MNYRKIIILPAFFFLSHIIYIGCCKCTDFSSTPYYGVSSITVNTLGSGKAVIDTGAVTRVDSIFLNYSFRGNCVASKNSFSFFVNESYACKCRSCGDSGIKVKIASIIITSDSTYNNIPANTSLNNFFKINAYRGTITMASFKNEINTNVSSPYGLQLFSIVKPGNTKGQVLKLSVLFVDGRQLIASTKRIYWQ